MNEQKYHVNSKGEVSLCTARKSCPFGNEHFSSQEEGRKAYELKMSDDFIQKIKNPSSVWHNSNKALYLKLKEEFVSRRNFLLSLYYDLDPEEDDFDLESTEFKEFKEFLSVTEYTHGNTPAINGAFSETMLEYSVEDLKLFSPNGSDAHNGIPKFLLKDHFKNLDEVVEQLDNFLETRGMRTGDKIVYRGMLSIPSDWRLDIGEIIKFDSFVSTSLDPDIAIKYSGAETIQGYRQNVIFALHTKNGAYVNGMKIISSEDEREVLFKRGTKWKIKSENYFKYKGSTALKFYTLKEIE